MKQKKRVTKAPEVRREELLQAASKAFQEKGIAATGIGDITDRADVARGTFYLYFSSKDEVVAELWRRYVAGFMELTDELLKPSILESCPEDVVLKLITELTHHALAHAYLHRLVYSTADAAAIELCKRSDDAILERLTEALNAYFRQLGKVEVDVDLLASLLFHGLDGALHQAIMRGEPINERRFIEAVQQFTTSALRVNQIASHNKDSNI